MRIPRIVLLLLASGALMGLYQWMPARLPKVVVANAKPSADLSDRNSDGTPDFLELHGPDGDAFRAWFTFLAETTYYQAAEQRPAEVVDCAALLRFAYREAVKSHDGEWATALKLPLPPVLPSIGKYHYPETPIAPNLFRVREGSDRAFAQFADAETLRKYNTYFVSKDIRAARAGDLLFYHQSEQDMPDHAMIFVGNSHFDDDSQQRIVYHTGPIGTEPGEIRRPTVEQLINHREPRWHPVPANGRFLGVYRWNILQ